MNNTLTHIASYMASINNIDRVVLFGSRARGTHRQRSDYDIAIFGELTVEDKINIEKYINYDVPTLHKIDCIYVMDIAEDSAIANNINNEGIKIYERK